MKLSFIDYFDLLTLANKLVKELHPLTMISPKELNVLAMLLNITLNSYLADVMMSLIDVPDNKLFIELTNVLASSEELYKQIKANTHRV